MSDERLDALGLPRREFLKRAAIGAFAVPAIVSFGLSGTAEAAPGCFPNQNFANQADQMNDNVIVIWQREQSDLIDPGFASELRKRLLDIEGRTYDHDLKGACQRLDEFIRLLQRASGKRIDTNSVNILVGRAQQWSNQLGCGSC